MSSSFDEPRKITLRSRINEVTPEGTHRLRVWVSEAEGMEAAIFVYQRMPQWPGETEPRDVFVAVASVADLSEFPATEPEGSSPFFRLSSFDVVFRSVYDLTNSWDLVKQDVTDLVDNLNKLDEEGVEDEFVVG